MCLVRRYEGKMSSYKEMLAKSTPGHPSSIGACQMMHRDHWLKMRGFDEDLVGWGVEDHDLRDRAIMLGLKPKFIEDRTSCIHMDHPVDWDNAYQNNLLWAWHSRLATTRKDAGLIVRNEGREWGKVYKKPRKRILNLVATSLVGGVEMIYKGLIEHLDHEKYEMWTIITTLDGPLQDDYMRVSDYFISITTIPPADHFNECYYGVGRVKAIKQLIRGVEFDVLHIWNSESGYSLGKTWSGRVVNGMYGDYSFNWLFFTRRNALIHKYMGGKNYCIVGDNPENAKLFPDIEFRFIHTGIDDPDVEEVWKDPKSIVWVGRPSDEKQMGLYLDIAKLLPRYTFHVITPYVPEGIIVPSNARFHIAPSRKEIYNYYKASDIYLNTSSMEGLPLTLLEAMKCGCYPICPAVGGIPNRLKDAGTLMPVTATAQDYADMVEAWRNLPKREKAGVRKKVLEAVKYHSYEQMVKEITEAWQC
jgi:glycosyltransferase involved in cell wall biosynthesis